MWCYRCGGELTEHVVLKWLAHASDVTSKGHKLPDGPFCCVACETQEYDVDWSLHDLQHKTGIECPFCYQHDGGQQSPWPKRLKGTCPCCRTLACVESKGSPLDCARCIEDADARGKRTTKRKQTKVEKHKVPEPKLTRTRQSSAACLYCGGQVGGTRLWEYRQRIKKTVKKKLPPPGGPFCSVECRRNWNGERNGIK